MWGWILVFWGALGLVVAAPPGVAVFEAGKEGYDCYRIPAIVGLGSSGVLEVGGTLVAFAEGRKFSCADHDWNDIVVKRSTDGGLSWGALSVAYSNSSASHHVTLGNPAPVVLSDGRLVLFFCRDNKEVFFGVSEDAGASWSAWTEITSQVVGSDWSWVATGPPGSIQLPNGRVVVAADHISASAGSGSHVFYSDDMVSFHLGTLLEQGNECQAAALPGGGALLAMRPQSGEEGRGFAWSSDGVHFGNATFNASLPDPHCEGSLVAGGPGLVLSNACSASQRANLCLHTSADQGHSWNQGPTIYPGPSAYSALLPLNLSHVGVLWEAGEKSPYEAIQFQIATL